MGQLGVKSVDSLHLHVLLGHCGKLALGHPSLQQTPAGFTHCAVMLLSRKKEPYQFIG